MKDEFKVKIISEFVGTKSKMYSLIAVDFCKIPLSCFDDKIYILGDGINSLTYFHKDIKRQ